MTPFDENSRLYTLVNSLYMSPIQNGIQTAHIVSDMAAKYRHSERAVANHYFDWADLGKTIIVYGGGMTGVLAQWAERLAAVEQFGIPFADFHESEFCLGGIRTAVGVVLPKTIYDVAAEWRQSDRTFNDTQSAKARIGMALADLTAVHYDMRYTFMGVADPGSEQAAFDAAVDSLFAFLTSFQLA